MDNVPMMKCGHAANATSVGEHGETIPACAICAGLTPDALIVNDTLPNIEGRKARCPHCKKEVDSRFSLAFFEYRPDFDVDYYYCGCFGWD